MPWGGSIQRRGVGSGEASPRRWHGVESARMGNTTTGLLRGSRRWQLRSRGAEGPVGAVGWGWEGRGAAQAPAAQGCCHVASRAGPLERGSEGLQARWRRLLGRGGGCAPAAALTSGRRSKLVPSLGGCCLHRRLVVVPSSAPVRLRPPPFPPNFDLGHSMEVTFPVSKGGLQLVLSPARRSPSGPAPPSAAQLP